MQHSKNPPSGDTAITALIASLQECLPGNGPNKAYDREKLKEAAEKLSIALETPGDTVQRVAYLVSQSLRHLFSSFQSILGLLRWVFGLH